MLETQIESPVCGWAEEDGWLVRKLQYPGRRGAPDRMFGKKDCGPYGTKGNGPIFIEFKKPGDLGKRTQLQVNEGQRYIDAGFNYFYCDTIQSACDVLGIRNRNATTTHTRKAPRRPRSL